MKLQKFLQPPHSPSPPIMQGEKLWHPPLLFSSIYPTPTHVHYGAVHLGKPRTWEFIGLVFSAFFSFQLRLRWKNNLSSLISSSACCCFKYKRTKELQQLSLVLSPIMPKAEMPPPFSSSPVVRTRRKHTTHHISPILGTQKGPLRFPEIDGPAPPPFLFLLFFYAFLSLRNVDKCGSASLDSLYRVPTACTVWPRL